MKTSAGLLLFRRSHGSIEVMLVHPGGPIWAKRDAAAWSIPKGEPLEGEDLLSAARREFTEELGHSVEGRFIPLTPVRQPGRKTVHAWAVETDFDAARIASNTFTLEWPPRSGHVRSFPEIDRAEWFALEAARAKILTGQAPLLDELLSLV
jgi:predicted NUDIX family NTP pyrophosphohydrolase